MNRMTKLLTLGVAAIVVLSIPTQIFALCSGISEPAQNFGGKIANCPDARPVAGFVGAIGQTATVNSAGIDVICEDGSAVNQQSVLCQGEAGVPGDGFVTFSFDWGNLPPANGCPNQAQVPNVGRNIFGIVCNNGAGALMTVAFDIGSGGYVLDFAHPYDPGTGFYDVVLSPNQNGLKLATFSRTGGSDTACIDQTTAPVKLYSDCDPGSLANAFGVTCPDTTPAVAAGANLFTFSGPATGGPQDLRTSAWQTAATTAGPGGSKCVNYPTPGAGLCTWIGSTSVVGGSDTGAISGWVQVCAGDPTAATDKVKINSAAFDQGKLAVGFATENESLIVGFNVYAGSTKLNTGLIAAKGTGSNSYSFEVGRGAVKSNKTVTVEAVKSDGTVVKTAPANVK
ncbi:MAG TPA: hypothetical protein VFB49_12270 [Patescibacteria group bacterium]|nr:hypothetical protein [Patescibacteria group bacterium]